jgi:hypothetical protein
MAVAEAYAHNELIILIFKNEGTTFVDKNPSYCRKTLTFHLKVAMNRKCKNFNLDEVPVPKNYEKTNALKKNTYFCGFGTFLRMIISPRTISLQTDSPYYILPWTISPPTASSTSPRKHISPSNIPPNQISKTHKTHPLNTRLPTDIDNQTCSDGMPEYEQKRL